MNKNYSDAKTKLKELKAFCALEGIPFFGIIAEDNGVETKYHAEVVTPLQAEIELVNDKITKFNAAVSNDFYIKPVTAEEKALSDAALFDSVLAGYDD